ncbi:hypothetical protein [Massilia sp. BJB1822]|uniref:hypothetical protein n=1 Tax=Massilia sp. BJB1822 TaxID=2744470 RepID=UPI0015948976|nr:hypothetical protein [Massilia sp. BJB1822]NVE01485.1 hypothetical protein [Massilia sp. BJB1822]
MASACAAPGSARIEWIRAEVVPGEGPVNAALFVPVKLNGMECKAQLDTGAPGIVHFHQSFERDAARPAVVEALGIRHEIQGPPNLAADQLSCPKGIRLSLGNQFFEQGTLTIDLKQEQVRFVSGSTLANDGKALPFFYPQWDLNSSGGGHVVIELGDSQGRKRYAMLDTGAASFGISALSAASWRQLTGKEPAAGPGVTSYGVSSWGKTIPCYRVRSSTRFDLGQEQALENADLSYCETASFKPGQQLAALIGLRNFANHAITIDYPARRWRIAEASAQ